MYTILPTGNANFTSNKQLLTWYWKKRAASTMWSEFPSYARLSQYFSVRGNWNFMIKFSFVFLILFTIGVFSAVHPELGASVVPGWDTLILPPRTIVLLCQILWLGVAAVIYYLTERKGRAVSQICFKIHLFSSLTVFVDRQYLRRFWGSPENTRDNYSLFDISVRAVGIPQRGVQRKKKECKPVNLTPSFDHQ